MLIVSVPLFVRLPFSLAFAAGARFHVDRARVRQRPTREREPRSVVSAAIHAAVLGARHRDRARVAEASRGFDVGRVAAADTAFDRERLARGEVAAQRDCVAARPDQARTRPGVVQRPRFDDHRLRATRRTGTLVERGAAGNQDVRDAGRRDRAARAVRERATASDGKLDTFAESDRAFVRQGRFGPIERRIRVDRQRALVREAPAQLAFAAGARFHVDRARAGQRPTRECQPGSVVSAAIDAAVLGARHRDRARVAETARGFDVGRVAAADTAFDQQRLPRGDVPAQLARIAARPNRARARPRVVERRLFNDHRLRATRRTRPLVERGAIGNKHVRAARRRDRAAHAVRERVPARDVQLEAFGEIDRTFVGQRRFGSVEGRIRIHRQRAGVREVPLQVARTTAGARFGRDRAGVGDGPAERDAVGADPAVGERDGALSADGQPRGAGQRGAPRAGAFDRKRLGAGAPAVRQRLDADAARAQRDGVGPAFGDAGFVGRSRDFACAPVGAHAPAAARSVRERVGAPAGVRRRGRPHRQGENRGERETRAARDRDPQRTGCSGQHLFPRSAHPWAVTRIDICWTGQAPAGAMLQARTPYGPGC